jgi:CRISP-associated protein Cas1
MTSLPVLDSDAPPVRVMALHALAYCERLFYLEEVEEIRVADDRVFAGRQLHAALAADEDGEVVSVELASTPLGLAGKIDCLRRRDGSYLPYEHKRGRCRRETDPLAGVAGSPTAVGTPAAWSSDRLQVIAYALLIEDAFGQPVTEGRVRYHTDNVTVRVPIDVTVREELRAAIARARELRESVERPPVTDNERLCAKCSLAPVCLPEEVRQARQPERDPTRLFPPDRDGATLHVVAQGARVGVSKDSLVVTPREGEWEPSKHPIRNVETILLHGFAQISTQAIRKCSEYEIGIHWLTVGGGHTASLVPTAGPVQRRVRQYKALTEAGTCLRLAKALVQAKVEGQYKYLLRATRGDDDTRQAAQADLDAIQQELRAIGRAADRDAVRGHEGAAAVAYFRALRRVLAEGVPDELRFDGRNRRPPLDRFNALLSFGYGLLYTSVMRALLACGLEPALGFFHTPRSAAHPLVLDLMELFRVTLWDMVVVASLNRLQWDPAADFVATKAKVWLSDDGRKKAIGLYEGRLEETWKHPVLDYSLSYARTIELEARLLEKEWTGEPGLFARSRLR